MSNINSYYLYKRQRKPSSATVWEDIHPLVLSLDGEGTKPVVLKEENSIACGFDPDVTPIYRFVEDGTYCMNCQNVYTFTLSGGSQSVIMPYPYESSAHTFDIVSNDNGFPVLYSSTIGYLSTGGTDWLSCASTGYGDGGFVINAKDNIYNSNRSGYVKLVQNGSGMEVMITIVQTGGTWDWLFYWASDSSTARTMNVSSAASSFTLNITNFYYHYPAAPVKHAPFEGYWVQNLTYNIASDYTSVTIDYPANTSGSEIVRVLVLHQFGSNNTISVEIHQAPS